MHTGALSPCAVFRHQPPLRAPERDFSHPVPRSQLHPGMCKFPDATVVARNMLNATEVQFESMLRGCLESVLLLDLSYNFQLSNLTWLQQSLKDFKIILSVSVDDKDGNQHVSVLQMEASPIACALRRELALREEPPGVFNNPGLLYEFPTLVFKCECGVGFQSGEDGVCEATPPFWTTGKIVGLAVGCVILALAVLVYLLVPYYRKRTATLSDNLELHVGLLEESQTEVQALRKAWEIAEAEVTLDAALSEGAFGEVWRGRWGDLPVAVKVLKQAVMEFDDTARTEFEREVEFMQRTRHTNIVRFYGAGQRADGTPFLVEELLALGSLADLLHKGSRGGVTLDWGLKTRLAHDTAAGMAHIHSLGHIHRDLKSGNVLITQSLQAKVADFGSVGRMLKVSHAASSKSPKAALRGRRGILKHEMGSDEASSSSLTSTSLNQTIAVGTPLYVLAAIQGRLCCWKVFNLSQGGDVELAGRT